jgi:chromosomal replication initiation ATPase DnaA
MRTDEKSLDERIAMEKKRIKKLRRLVELQQQSAKLECRVLFGKTDLAKAALEIAELVCERYGVAVELLAGKSREEQIVVPRHVVFFLVRKLTGKTYAAIGKLFGRDHGTILHGCDRVEDRASVDRFFKMQVEAIERAIKSRFKGQEEERKSEPTQ